MTQWVGAFDDVVHEDLGAWLEWSMLRLLSLFTVSRAVVEYSIIPCSVA